MATKSPYTSNVRVGVRVRPMASKELQQGGKGALSVDVATVSVGQKQFTYDAVFSSSMDQEDLYNSLNPSLLDSFIDGYNATILAYGQTGSGKTYTMGSEAHTQPEGSSQVGLIPRFISSFFERMEQKKKETGTLPTNDHSAGPILLDYTMYASFLEVYGEDVYDLLDSQRTSLPLREDATGGVVIAGLNMRAISNPSEALQVLHEGTNNRTTAATLMNLTSSRSHAVFTVHLSQVLRSPGKNSNSVDITSSSKFTFVDLAGSERMKKTGAEGERAREGIKINEGLLALGNVINALADDERIKKDKKVHVPYRQSKLTRLLQDALGGNSQTLFLACVSPSDTNVSETLSTLHYANRARNIRNAPTKNLDAPAMELQRLHSLTRILQCELVKARFQEQSCDNEDIGVVNQDLMERHDVEEYIQLLHQKAIQLSDDNHASNYTLCLQPAVSNRKSALLELKLTTTPMQTCENFSENRQAATTPAKALTDRFDDSFLVDINPDEDMAILDHLLELQQHDHEYDKARKRDDEQLETVDGELEKEEKLLLQLRENLKAYQGLKTKYEELMAEVQQLESEKASLSSQLEEATADPSSGCSAVIKRQLERVELSLSRARRETLTQREKYKAAETEAKKGRFLEKKIEELKLAKMNLLKKQKEEAARYKETSEAKTKELLALRRKEKASESRMAKMQAEIQHHKTNLEKRKHFITKLSDKLKQTESHLIKLLSMRQRDLVEKASSIGRKEKISTTRGENSKRLQNSQQNLSSHDHKSMKCIFDKMVDAKIEESHLKGQFADRVTAYTETMQLIVANVKSLKDLQENRAPEESIAELKESIARLELKLELLGGEVKEMESSLPDEENLRREEDAVKRLMATLPNAALRTMLMDSFSRIVEAEMETKANHESIVRKDAALMSFESEVELLNGKVESLTRDLAARCVLMQSGKDVFDALKEVTTQRDVSQQDFLRVQLDLRNVKTEKESLKEKKREIEAELSRTKDYLALAETSLAKLNASMETKVFMEKLHRIWDELGVGTDARDTVRKEIRTCLEDTCQAKLNEAVVLKNLTEKRVAALRSRKELMENALNLEKDDNERKLGLLEEELRLRQRVDSLEKPFKYSNARRHNIISALDSLKSTLRLSKEELPTDLRTLSNQLDQAHPRLIGSATERLEDEDAETDLEKARNEIEQCTELSNLPILPTGALDSNFLSRCEKELADLRVQKAVLLAKNRETAHEINELVNEMHLTSSTLVVLIEKALLFQESGIPAWWNRERAVEILKATSSTTPRDECGETEYLTTISRTLSTLAGNRRRLSGVLRKIVEKAQETLLDIVGREVDASEAYASFHDALVKLPALSEDFARACVSEVEALVQGAETMIQSEIETLTVVWEALNVSSEHRRSFWGRIDNDGASNPVTTENAFEALNETFVGEIEQWIPSVVASGQKANRELEAKLAKLHAIHKEVERLRSKQDIKSQILSLDSEVRILNLKLLDFEEMQCSKQRLVTKKSGSNALLKEERFRKQMKAKFVAKLGQLASLLRSWEQNEGHPFQASLLSDDVRMLIKEPNNMENWIEKRTKLMPSRTVLTMTPRKRSFDNENTPTLATRSATNPSKPLRGRSNLTPPRKKIATSTPTRATGGAQVSRYVPMGTSSESCSRNQNKGGATSSSPRRKRKPTEQPPIIQNESSQHDDTTRNHLTRSRVARSKRKESSALPPFGRILSDQASPTERK